MTLWEKKRLKLKYKIGQKVSKKFSITDEKVKQFAQTTGDKNPIHLNEEYAKTTLFKKRISHGMLVASHISNVLANDLPGPGTIYLSQTLTFKKPVFIDDDILVEVEIIKIRDDKNIMTLVTNCYNDKSELVIEGESCVKFS